MNSMPIFVSTACLPGTELLESRISLYHRHNLKAIEIGAGVVVNCDSLTQIQKTDGQFLIHNYFPPPIDPFVLNLASRDSNIRQHSLELISNALALSSRLGTPFYSVHAGFITDPTSFGATSFIFPMPASPDEAQLAMTRFITALNIALAQACHYDQQLLVENNVCSPELRGKLLLQTVDEFLTLFNAAPSSRLGILLDTGHLNVTACTLGFDRIKFVEQVAPYVRALHIHDNDGTADTHRPIQPGSWVLDVLRHPQLAGLPIVVEAKFKTVSELRKHVDWLRKEVENK